MDANHQHLLVVAAVEDADVAACRKRPIGAPQEVVRQFLGSRRLEAGHLHTLRIYARHHVLDRAVLAGSVHRLQHAQHGPFILCIQLLLQRGQTLHILGQHDFRLLLCQQVIRGVGRVELDETETVALGHAITVEDTAHLLARKARCGCGIDRCVHERSPEQPTVRAWMKSKQPRVTALARLGGHG